MPASIFGNPAAVIQLNQALFGIAPGNGKFTNQLGQANAVGAIPFARQLGQTVAASNESLAATVLANVGIVNATLQTALVQAFAAFPNDRGVVVLNLTNILTTLEGNAVYGAAAAQFNAQVATDFQYSNNPVNTSDSAVNAGTVTLTANTDILTGNVFTAGLVFTPGGDDRINSLQDEDTLTGTGTNATLNAVLGNANDNGGTTVSPVLNNISTVNVQFTGSAPGPQGVPVNTLDLQDATGLTTLNVTRINQGLGTQQILFANINTSGTNTFGISGVSTPAFLDYDFQEGALSASGAASQEAATFNINNVTLRQLRIGDNLANAVGTAEGFETVTINSQGANNQIDFFNSAQTRTLNLVGSANLGLSNSGANVLVAGNNAGLGQAYTVSEGEFNQYQGQAFTNSGGPLAAINGSTATGRLTLDISGFEAGRPDPTNSGQIVFTTVQGGTANDTIISGGVIGDTNLVINGNGGTDTLLLYGNLLDTVTTNTVNPSITNIENLEVRPQAAGTIIADVSEVEGLQRITVRNETANPAPAIIDLRELTAAQAAALTINHGVSRTTGINGALGDSTQLLVNLDNASGTNDTVAISLVTDLNNTERFNFALDADGNAAAATTAAQGRAVGTASVENITINDTDNEANIIELVKAAEHTGAITLTGGQAGQFLSLDATANAYRYDESGARLDGGTGSAGVTAINGRPTNGSRSDVGAGPAERLVAANFNSTAYTGDVIIRVSDNANAGSLGGQNIQFGAGNDTVIFDQVSAAAANRFTAGLTISDTVNGGAGTDILAIDGDGVAVTITASEWTNVSNFEVIRLVGNGVGGSNARNGVNSYNLTLTNDLLATNGAVNGNGKQIIIVNDNDATNDAGQANPANSVNDNTVAANGATNNGNGVGANIAAATGIERGVTIDARSLTANNSFEYRGEEGSNGGNSSTADRFILADANINGAAIIDGGASSNVTQNTSVIAGVITAAVNANRDVDSVRNADVIEVRNAATVSEGDLANISNVGTLEFTNDTTIAQNSILVLNDAIVDRMVDAYQASRLEANVGVATQSLQNQERLVVKAINNPNLAAATTGVTIQAGSLTGLSALDVFLDRDTAATAINVTTGGGNDRVVLLGNFNAGVYADTFNGEAINAFANNVVGQRAATGTINLGGQTGIGNVAQQDQLITYGAINLAAVVIAGVEQLIANSDITLTETQFRSLTSISFSNTVGAHTLTIISDGSAGAIDLSKVSVNGSALTITNNSNDMVTGGPVLTNGATSVIGAGGAINVTVAQAVAGDFTANNPVTLLDTGANIATALGNNVLALNDAVNPGEIDIIDASNDVLNINVLGYGVAGARLVTGDTITLADTGANTAPQLTTALNDAKIDVIDATDNVLTVSAAQFAIGTGKLVAGDTITLADTGANLSSAVITAAQADAKIDVINATDDVLSINVAQFVTGVTKFVTGDQITLADTSANIAAQLTNALNQVKVDVIDATDNLLTVSVAQFVLGTAKLVAGDVVTLSDTSANIAPQLTAALGDAKIDVVDATDDILTVTAAQFAAGAAKLVTGDVITLADTGANTAAQLTAALNSNKIDVIDTTDNVLNVLASQVALGTAKLVAGDTITLFDSGANIAGQLTTALGDAKIDVIDAADNVLALTAAQLALGTGKLLALDTITLADTAANTNAALTAAFADAKVDVIDATNSTNAATAVVETVAQALVAGNQAKLVTGDFVTVSGTGADLATNLAAFIADMKVDSFDATNDAVTLSAGQIGSLTGLGGVGKPFAANDVITITATAGVDNINNIDDAKIGGTADKIIKFAGGQAAVATFTNVNNAAALASGDTFAGAFDTFSGFDAGGDKLDLTAFNLITPNAVAQFTANGSTVSNGGYIVVKGNLVGNTFTAGNGGGDNDYLVAWDADTGAAIAQVAVVLAGTGTITAADLIV